MQSGFVAAMALAIALPLGWVLRRYIRACAHHPKAMVPLTAAIVAAILYLGAH